MTAAPTPPDFQAMAREMIEEDNEYGHSDESLAGLIATALENAYAAGRQSGMDEAAKWVEVNQSSTDTDEDRKHVADHLRALGGEKL